MTISRLFYVYKCVNVVPYSLFWCVSGFKWSILYHSGPNPCRFREVATSTTGYTRKSGIIILLYFVLTSPHSSITTLLVNFGRSFSFRSTTISYTDFVSLVPSDKRCYVGRNDRYEVGVRDKKHENSLPLDLHGVKFERISRIFDPTF